MLPELFTLPLPEKRPNLQYSSVDFAVSVYARASLFGVHVRQPFNVRRLIRPTCIFGRFCQFFWRIGVLRKTPTHGSPGWMIIILSYSICCFNLFKPAIDIYQKYCKRCKFVVPVRRPKVIKPAASGSFDPRTLHRGLAPRPPL